MLLDRLPERAALSQLLDAARAGRSGVLVMRGEPGIGKTALLDWAVESAAGLRVVRVAGVESEMELAFAALQQLCAPMLDQLGGLPDPQRAALGVAFGLTTGAAPDRFLVGLASLSLQPADRRAAVHQPRDRRLPPAEGLHQARRQLTEPARSRASRPARRGTAGRAAGLIPGPIRAPWRQSWRSRVSRHDLPPGHGYPTPADAHRRAPNLASMSRPCQETRARPRHHQPGSTPARHDAATFHQH
jgi:hypothetical protein